MISSDAAESFGDHSFSSAWYAGVVVLLVITPNTDSTRSSLWPARSSPSTVFTNVGGAGLLATASASRRCSSIPNWRACGNSSGLTRCHGGTPSYGPVQSASRTLFGTGTVGASGAAAASTGTTAAAGTAV